MRPKRVLFPRAVDAANINAQAQNVQAILRDWNSPEVRPTAISFSDPAARVAANPNVDIVRIAPNRLWLHRLVSTYLRGFDAVFCPGIHHFADWFALKALDCIRARPMMINTFEGPACSRDNAAAEKLYSEVAGHRVYCARVHAEQMHRLDALDEMSDHIIAITPFMGRLARSRFGEKVSVLPLGVDTALFAPRAKPSASSSRTRVVAVGGVSEHKRPEAFIGLARRFPAADFVWVGDGELRSLMLKEVQRLNLSNIGFPGAKQPAEVAEEFMNADIFVHTARSEGFGKVSLEAASAGLPAVVFGFYETPIVEDGKNGFVVWTDEEMAVRLGQLLRDPSLAMRMGAAGRAMAEKWDWLDLAPRWERKIVDLVCNGERRR